MKKQDMKVGMHVAVGRVSRSRYAGRRSKAVEAYILVLPDGQVNSYNRRNKDGKVGVAYRSTTGKWEPQWVPSVEILHGHWPTYSVEWDAADKAYDQELDEEIAREADRRARQASVSASLEAMGITSLKYGKTLGLTEVEKLLALLDEARGTAETMRRERGEDYPLPWDIDTTEEVAAS